MIAARQPADLALQRLARPALVVGLVALALGLAGSIADPARGFQAYLLAYALWLQLPLGCLALGLLQFLTGGAWGLAIRRIVEAGARTMPLLALLFLPILVGLPRLYPWAQPALVAQDPLLQYKNPYLNAPFFVVRAALYFITWGALAHYLGRWSAEQDCEGDPALLGKLQRLATGGAVLLGLTASFAAIDWLMSLEPDWYSTAYGAVVAWGAVLTAMPFAIVLLIWLGRRPPLAEVLSPLLLNELGSLLLGFLILWAYLAYFQYLIIWSGNLGDEIPWFLRRTDGEWRPIAWLVVIAAFAIPFSLLLFRGLKRNSRALAAIAIIVLATRPLYELWLVKPAFVTTGWLLDWRDLAAAVGLGGVWLAAFFWQLGRQPLLPPNDPRLPAALESVHERG